VHVKKPATTSSYSTATPYRLRFQVSARQADVTDSMETITPRCWNDLNADTWSKALAFVSIDDLLEVRLVCSSSFRASESPATWTGRFNGSISKGEDTRESYDRFVRSLWVGRKSKGLLVTRTHRQTRTAPLYILNHMDRLENITIDWWHALVLRDSWMHLLLSNPETCQRLKALTVDGCVFVPSNITVAEFVDTVEPDMFAKFSDVTRKQDEEESPNKRPKACTDRRSITYRGEAVFPNLHTVSLVASDVETTKSLARNAPNVGDLSFPDVIEPKVFEYVWPSVTRLTIGFESRESTSTTRGFWDKISNVMKNLVNWTLLESLVVDDITPCEVEHVANNVILPQIKELSISMDLTLFHSNLDRSTKENWPVSLFRAFPSVVRLRLVWKDLRLKKRCVRPYIFALQALPRWLQEPGNDHAPFECVTIEYSDPSKDLDIDLLDSLVRCSRIHHVCLVLSKDILEQWEKTILVPEGWPGGRHVTLAHLARGWRDRVQKEFSGKLSTNF
jgi:hypothetical protein